MIWGCISYNGVGRLEVVDGNLKGIRCTGILPAHLHASVDENHLDDDFILQKDNAPCYKPKIYDGNFGLFPILRPESGLNEFKIFHPNS